MNDDYVIDASALVLALVGKDATADLLRQRLPTMRRHAPHLIDAEVGNVLRLHERRGLISTEEAHSALDAGHLLVDQRYPQTGRLAALAWTWRATITFYDALYVALAVQLRAPLVTADARLARSAGPVCEVDVI